MTKNNKANNLDCPVCYEPKRKDRIVFLPCGCFLCPKCIISWILTKIQESYYQTHQKLPCVTAQCKKSFLPQDIIHNLTIESATVINQALFAVYLNQTEDIRKCVSGKCKYAGFIDAATTKCKKPLECEACRTQWKEKAHFTSFENVKDWWRQRTLLRYDKLSDKWKEFHTEACPKCKVLIEKNSGCDHMTCIRCRYEFCWICKIQTKSHSHDEHDKKSEQSKPPTPFLRPYITLAIIILTLVYLLNLFVTTLMNQVIYPHSESIIQGLYLISSPVLYLVDWVSWMILPLFVPPIVATTAIITIKDIIFVSNRYQDKLLLLFLLAVCFWINSWFSTFETMGKIMGAEIIGYFAFVKNKRICNYAYNLLRIKG